jgi:hypothetical protein
MHARSFVFLAAAILATATGHASNVGLSTIEQPVNLGTEADPSRIPLGPVPTESNYHYGRGPVITAPLPIIHGSIRWENGVELNQNLASVFGIEVDNHDLPHSPATIRLYKQPKPAYSPYSREQVLAATIHCLLRSNSGSPKAPIVLKITADDPADSPLAERYAGNYINSPDNHDGPPVEVTQVPDTVLETDANGVTWVVFPKVSRSAKSPRPPVFIPFRFGGEGAPDNPTWQLLPVWTGTERTRESSLEAIGRPHPLFYDCFQPGSGGPPEGNGMFATEPRGEIAGFDVNLAKERIEARLSYPQTDAETLSAIILSLVFSAAPTPENPLIVTLQTHHANPHPWFEAFEKCPGWQVTENNPNRGRSLEARFVWDAAQAKLANGAVPSGEIVRTGGGPLFIEVPNLPANEEPEEKNEAQSDAKTDES